MGSQFRMRFGITHLVHAMRKLAAGGQVGKHNIAGNREQRVGKTVTHARRAGDVELERRPYVHEVGSIAGCAHASFLGKKYRCGSERGCRATSGRKSESAERATPTQPYSSAMCQVVRCEP